MIEAIKEIGEYVLRKEGKNIDDPLDALDILIDDPESNHKKPSYKHIFLITLKKINENYEYIGIEEEEYDKDRITRYLYKQGSSNGPDITPTSRITTVESTFKNTKILPWFKNYREREENEEFSFLNEIGECLRKNKDKILEDLKSKYNGINKKEKAVLTLKINGNYLKDYNIFKKILLENSKEKFYSKYGEISKGENEICYVCKEKKAEVYGFVSTYSFYTVDKPGFVSGGFQQKEAWKNYPVCLNCALKLEAGKKYLKENLTFNFYGFNYHLIPKFILKTSYEHKKNLFDLIEEWHDPKLKRKEIDRLTQDENEILELMSKQKNYLNFNFMFYEAPKGYDGAVFNILLYIEDVLPSRLKKLFDIKREVDKINIFKNCLVDENQNKKGEKPLEFNFGILRTFFPRISNERTYDKYFLEITNRIFADKPIDYSLIVRFIMQKIRDEFVKDYPTRISTLKGFMLLNYLNKLELLKNIVEKEVIKVNEKDKWEKKQDNEEIDKKVDDFFESFFEFFDSDAKKAVFLEGVLTQFLLDIQYQERKATPFRVKLKGLKLDEKQVKKLLPEIQNKLEEYGKNYYRELEAIISNYFISAGNRWKLTNDEISFYFVLGMNLSNLFKKEGKMEVKENE